MKNSLVISSMLLTILLASCQQKTQEKTLATIDSTAKIEEQMVGNDLDKHGCKGSAGYTWSVLKNDCIRVFETGLRLNAEDVSLDKSLSAFAVFGNEENENEFDVEIFLPMYSDSSIILKPIKDKGAGTWSNEKYKLSQWKGMYTLEEGKKTLYQGHR